MQIIFFASLTNKSTIMEIRNVITFTTPLGFKERMYVSESEITKLLNAGIIRAWDYHIQLYGFPLIQQFVYSVHNFRFAQFLVNLKKP